jgi:hypothetical protein
VRRSAGGGSGNAVSFKKSVESVIPNSTLGQQLAAASWQVTAYFGLVGLTGFEPAIT